VSHDRDLAGQDLEELAEELWTLAEEGRERLSDLRTTSQVDDPDRALARMIDLGLARLDPGDRIELTARGSEIAQRQVRRHRLAEVLLSTVMEVSDDRAVNRTACVMEHVLGAEVTESVCAFLGHPKFCPHGKAIPAGPCCRSFASSLEPLVQPLTRLAVGESGRIVHIVPRDSERLARLSSMGVIPGAVVRLAQRSPAVVLAIGETTLALDPAITAEIYVKKTR